MTICNSRLGLWAWRDIICIWTTMKTRTPDLLSMMSYACANMAHCPCSMPTIWPQTIHISQHKPNLMTYSPWQLMVSLDPRYFSFCFSFFWYTCFLIGGMLGPLKPVLPLFWPFSANKARGSQKHSSWWFSLNVLYVLLTTHQHQYVK